MTTTGELRTLRAALRDQYTIERELGRGGMGVVFLARDVRLDRAVALKVLPSHFAEQAETRERFLREARTAAQLSHPHIVPVYRADEIDGLAFFAMGYVDGETFGDRIRDRGRLGAPEVVRVLREVAWALAYAHARGIVHRDVKPDNILLDRASGRAVVTDFGIARTTFDPSITQDGHVLGTVHYMSPEQCAGGTLDGRSDLYALGVAGFHALSGRLPFDGDSPQAIIVAHATRQAPRLRAVAPDVPEALAAVIDGCLQKDPAHRFATGEALAEALTKALEAAPPPGESGARTIMSTEQAHAVWRRAAQLQAEAAARLEHRVRDSGLGAETRAFLAGGGNADNGDARAETAAGVDAGSDAAPATSPSDAPTAGFRALDIEAAAVEAGISQRYVALAMAELKGAPGALQRPADVPDWKDAVATRLLGTAERSVGVTRAFRAAPRVVLAALGRILQAAPYGLELVDTVGGHPLDGGVLVFRIPDMVGADYRWTWTRYGVFAKELRMTIAPLPGDPRGCELSVHADLRSGLGANIGGYGAGIGLMSGLGGLFSAAIGAKALALAGAALAAPVLGVGTLFGLAAYAVSAPLYRWEIRKTSCEIERALAAVDASIRAIDIFGEAPPPRISGGSDDAAVAALLAGLG